MDESAIYIEKNKCTLCYSCVRHCPVKAIEVKVNSSFAHIVPERCITCGNCLGACPENAIHYLNGKNEVMSLLKKHEKVAAIIDTAVAGEFPDITDYRKLVMMLNCLGFSLINEISFGADLVAGRYKTLFTDNKGKFYISANCPVIVSYIQKYKPALLENLAPVKNPVMTMSDVVREKYGQDTRIVYIGACLSYKNLKNIDRGLDAIDGVLTFEELRELFSENNINENSLEFAEFNEPAGAKGALYPIADGILQAAELDQNLLTTNVYTASGSHDSLNVISEFEEHSTAMRKHLNVFFCEGCIMGPGSKRKGNKYLCETHVIDYTNKRLKELNVPAWNKNMGTYSGLDISSHFFNDDQRLPEPAPEKLNEIFKLLGKNAANTDAGCLACGYDTCHDFAVAVAQGYAKTEMCHSFSLRNKQDYIKSLKVANDKLAKAREALQESEKMARVEQQKARESSETVQAMMQKLFSGVVIVDDKYKIIQANRSFINMLGEDARLVDEVIPGLVGADLKTLVPIDFYKLFTYILESGDEVMTRDVRYDNNMLNVSVFTIKKSKIAGAIVRDMFTPEVRKEEVVKRVGEVINNNLEVVQKIAFLLGESASETERMLNSIIEFYKSGKH